jgi:hypothetical protein
MVRPAGPWSARFYWLGLLALPFLHLLILILLHRKNRSIVFKTSPTDSLSLTRSAVIQCVRTELAEEPSIVKHKVLISQAGRRAVDLRVELKVKPIENIPEMQARLGRQIRRALSDILGLENIRHIKVDVTSIEEPRKRRSDGPIPVVRRLEGPRASGTAAGAAAATAPPEPQDAEYRLEDDPPARTDDFSSLKGGPSPGNAFAGEASARVYDTGTIQVESVPEPDDREPREIELGESDAPPEPAPQPGPEEIHTDDLLEILGKSKDGEKRRSS